MKTTLIGLIAAAAVCLTACGENVAPSKPGDLCQSDHQRGGCFPKPPDPPPSR